MFNWRPSGKSTGCFQGSPCPVRVNTDRDTYTGLPVFVFEFVATRVLVFGVLLLGRRRLQRRSREAISRLSCMRPRSTVKSRLRWKWRLRRRSRVKSRPG